MQMHVYIDIDMLIHTQIDDKEEYISYLDIDKQIDK